MSKVAEHFMANQYDTDYCEQNELSSCARYVSAWDDVPYACDAEQYAANSVAKLIIPNRWNICWTSNRYMY